MYSSEKVVSSFVSLSSNALLITLVKLCDPLCNASSTVPPMIVISCLIVCTLSALVPIDVDMAGISYTQPPASTVILD